MTEMDIGARVRVIVAPWGRTPEDRLYGCCLRDRVNGLDGTIMRFGRAPMSAEVMWVKLDQVDHEMSFLPEELESTNA